MMSETKAEAPQVESLRWLRMFFEALAQQECRLHGRRILGIRVSVFRYTWDPRQRAFELTSDSWEKTGHVYALVHLSRTEPERENTVAQWPIEVALVNNRDSRALLKTLGLDEQEARTVLGVDRHVRRDQIELIIGLSGNFGVNYFVERFEVFMQLTPRLGLTPPPGT